MLFYEKMVKFIIIENGQIWVERNEMKKYRQYYWIDINDD